MVGENLIISEIEQSILPVWNNQHWNSIISTSETKYCSDNISNMHTMTLLQYGEYAKFKHILTLLLDI